MENPKNDNDEIAFYHLNLMKNLLEQIKEENKAEKK